MTVLNLLREKPWGESMGPSRKQLRIHYRRFDNHVPTNGKKLEQCVRGALHTEVDGVRLLDRFALRTWQRDGDDNLFSNLILDEDTTESSFVFGDIIHFTKGHLQALFDAGQQEAARADVREMPAQDHSQFIHSQMYWLVKNDHVFILQSQSLQTEAAESYLTWLLTHRTSGLPPGTPVVLSARFDAEAAGGDLEDIQELVIGGALQPPTLSPTQTAATTTSVTTEEIEQKTLIDKVSEGWSSGREILAIFFRGNPAQVDKVLDNIPADAELSVKVHIGFKTKKRKVNREALRDLEVGLRHVPDSQLTVRAKNGAKAADGSFRLHHNASIKLTTVEVGEKRRPGSLLDPDDVRRAMLEAYTYFLANGKITE